MSGRYELMSHTDGNSHLEINFRMSEGQFVARVEQEAQADGYLD